MSNTAGLGLKSSSSSRRKSIPDSGGSGSRAPAIVENLLIDLGKDQKSKLRDTLRKQVSVNGRDRTKHESASTAASNRRLTVNSVFNHYCRGYLPPGQTFEYIEKKAQVMDLKHFYDFMKDFGLFPGCFSSRHEVTLLFQKLNLMSKKKESRVELGRAQFETFIQGVLDLKAPAHQRGMTSEDALNTWRRGKLSGDFSYWNEIMKPMTFDDMDKLEAITESLGDDIHDHDDDDDDTHDIDGAVRQEIGVRNEQIRELIELICGHEHIPSLPFLKESGISLPSQPTHIQRLRIERDQIQECITWVADHINDLHHDQIDRSTLQTIQHQHSRLIQEFSNIIIQKYDLQHNYHQIIEQMELYEKHFQQIQLLSNNHHYLLQHHLDAERDRSCQLQNANNVLENHLHDKQQELDRLRYEYEQKMSIIRSELEAATSASMKTRSDLESECHRNRILQQQIDHERSERQHLSTQLSSVMEQIERDHDDLVQRQNAINDTVVQELHQAREHETDRTRYLNDSMKTLLEKFQEIQTESLRYLDLYMEERQQCLTLKAQLLQINTCLETSQTQSASLLTSLNNKVQECSGLEQQLQDLQQERDRLMEINQHYVANLKSASESLTRVQSEQCELQQSLESKIAEMQLLSHERESAIADLYLTKSQLTNATEKSQHLQELYDREQQRFLQ